MFAGIEPRLVRALARYVVHNDQRSSQLLGEFIDRNQHKISASVPRERPVVLRPRGRHHDLSAIYDRLKRDYFGGVHDARISWGNARRSSNRRSIKVGSFSVEDRLIRVHPMLDQESVPGFFLDWIVFHEMLHGKHAIRKVDGRRCFHPPEFAEEERQFPAYARARLWEKMHLDVLLGA
jgi:predicted metal-dependent hydrolase